MVVKTKKKHPHLATIIPILILDDKTVMNFGYKDQTLWLVYIIIGNLDAKTRQSQKRPGILFLGSISIIHEWSEDANNKIKNLKAKIYHMTLKIMLQHTYSSIISVGF